MNVADIIHSNHYQAQPDNHLRATHRHSDPNPRCLYEDRHRDVSNSLTATHLRTRSPAFPPSYAPPSPPLEDLQHLRTLPSIQSLINMDSGSRRGSEGSAERAPRMYAEHPRRNTTPLQGVKMEDLGQPIVSHPETRPLSPPVDPELVFDHPQQSPATTSSHSSTTAGAPYAGSILANSDVLMKHRRSPPRGYHTNTVPTSTSQPPFQGPVFSHPTPTDSTFAYPPATISGPQSMYRQQPLPKAFPPSVPDATSTATSTSSDTSPTDPNSGQRPQHQHQHHHYMAPNAAAAYPGQSTDRYVCHTCNKAFSRPSSLKIHLHSHTGEKPFICQHRSCGKAFSVRSNMKRHERGCHGGSVTEAP